MKPYKEHLLMVEQSFPVEVLVQDSTSKAIVADLHWHDCVEILYVLAGQAWQQVNDHQFQVYKDDIIIIREGDIHGTWCRVEDQTRIIVVKFLSTMLETTYSCLFESKYIVAFMDTKIDRPYHISVISEKLTELHQVFLRICDEYERQPWAYEIYIKGTIFQLIALLIRYEHISGYDYQELHYQMERILPALQFIESHFKDDILLSDVAQSMNMSYYYFSRLFKESTGKCFKEYLDFVRICEAEKLLFTKDLTITEVAYEVGYKNISSFNRVYKRVRGYSPSTIRKRDKSAEAVTKQTKL